MSSKKDRQQATRIVGLDFLLNVYLRPYQRRWLLDLSLRRIILKARQIGISDLIALEMVLISAGLHWSVKAHNCTIISKRKIDAADVVKKAKAWIRVLRKIPGMAEQLQTELWSASEISFVNTGFRILSETQNPDAGRGKTGHLYLDEYAYYQWQREIWLGALPSVFSVSYLRVSVICTPNGTGDHFHELWTETTKYPEWSRHRVDVHEAAADGFPIDIEKVRLDFSADQWAQEMECKFIGGEHEYFPQDLLNDSHQVWTPDKDAVLWLGIDTASVVDTTAVQCVWMQHDGLWLGDTYVLENMQYETDTQRARIGQDTVLDALIQHLRPVGAVFDTTGDQARKVRGFASIFNIIRHSRGGECHILPQQVRIEWKDVEVEEIKTALLAGRLKFASSRVDYVFTKSHAGEFAHTRFLSRDIVGAFVERCFHRSDFPILTQDFRKIHRKWIGPNRTTFDASRDGTGHADAFWAAVFGHSVARNTRGMKLASQATASQEYARPSSYSGYL